MVDVVAVHGAFRGGWSWDRVGTALENQGHRLHAPDLTGMGRGPQAEVGDVRLDEWIADVVAVFDRHGLRHATLVGHSMGGVVCQAALGALGDRVARLVLIDSPIITEGQRAVDVSTPGPVSDDLLPPRETWLPPTPVDDAQGFTDPDLASWVNERLCATPFGPQLDRCPPPPNVVPPTTIVFCAHTPAGFPSTIARDRCDADGVPYELLDSHHDAPLLVPEQVAALI